jgi:DNA-binding phage protein
MDRAEPGKVALHAWDATDHLRTEDDVRLFLEASGDEVGDDPQFMALAQAIVDLARNRFGLTDR